MEPVLSILLIVLCCLLMSATIKKYLQNATKSLERILWVFMFPVFLVQTIVGMIAFLVPNHKIVIDYVWFSSLFIYILLNCVFGIFAFIANRKLLFTV